MLNLLEECKNAKKSKEEFLHKASKIPGMYVPSMYEVHYKEDGTIAEFVTKYEDVPPTVLKEIEMNLSDRKSIA